MRNSALSRWIVGVLVGTCCSFAFARGVTLQFDHSVQIGTPSEEGLKDIHEVTPGTPVVLSLSKPSWIQSPGKVPVMFVPVSTALDDRLKVEMIDVAQWPSEKTDQEIDRVVANMLDLITQFQTSVASRQYEDAEKHLEAMTRLRDVPSLGFLKAYLEFVKGNVNRAETHLNRALDRFPANITGKQLHNAIKGKKND